MLSKIKNHKKALVITATTVILLSGGTFAYYASSTDKNTDNPSEASVDDNATPAAENTESPDQAKAKIAGESEKSQSQAGVKNVEPSITFAGERNGNIEVRSYVAGIYESNGTCTITFTKGGHKVSRSVDGVKDATYTLCPRVVINRDDFPVSGDWTLVVSYSSPSANGKSESRIIKI